jgi:hypothetical protein
VRTSHACDGVDASRHAIGLRITQPVQCQKTMIANISKLLNDIEFGDVFTLSQNDIDELKRVAFKGIGIINPSSTNKHRRLAETTLLKSLGDASPVVRFWSCYAVGQIKMKKALPILHELKAKDHEVCPGW